jgi:RimJ/RimL family protein N-acetyltransferase
MEYGIQRRTIYLVPPDKPDQLWFYDQFLIEEIWQMFGFPGPSRAKIMRAHRSGNLVIGMIKRVVDKKRIGFGMCFPPAGNFDFWEFGYAIPDPQDRDAYSAFNTCDAMSHYMFDHLRVEACGFRTREDNKAADAIVRRLGYSPFETTVAGGHKYTYYRFDRAVWEKRKARLERGEKAHPSGIGDTFVTLTPPYEPIVPREMPPADDP